MRSEPEALLRRLAAADEGSLKPLLAPCSGLGDAPAPGSQVLDQRLRALIRLAALLAIDAPTTSLRWAVELAASTGATSQAITEVLAATAAASGSAQVVASAPRLALALGFDIEVDGWDGS